MTDTRDAHTLPAVHAHHLVELVQRWRVEPEELLEGLGLTAAALTAPDLRLTLEQYERLVERARALTGEPGIGIYFGLNMRLASHGFLGFAAMTSNTIRDALRLAVRFAPTRTSALALRAVSGEVSTALIIEERASLGTAQDAILLALALGIWQIAKAVSGKELTGMAEFTFDKPDYIDRFGAIAAGVEIHFGGTQNRLVFANELLDLPIPMADPVALEMARQQCEREMNALGFGEDVVARLRAVLPLDDGGYRSMDEAAKSLGMSVRTLKRRLAALGTSFTSTLDEIRFETASMLLREGKASHDEIAERLGYSDASAFGRAFRRWTGTTPAAFVKISTSR